MRNAILILAILFLSMVGTGCSGASQPTAQPTPDNPKTRGARAEQEYQLLSSDKLNGDLRTEARTAITDFVKSNLPDWTVKGIASQPYEDVGGYSMDADLERQGHHIVVTFDVRKFFSDKGEGYWLAVPMNKFRFDRLRALTETDLRKQLQDAQNELDELKNPPDNSDEPEP